MQRTTVVIGVHVHNTHLVGQETATIFVICENISKILRCRAPFSHPVVAKSLEQIPQRVGLPDGDNSCFYLCSDLVHSVEIQDNECVIEICHPWPRTAEMRHFIFFLPEKDSVEETRDAILESVVKNRRLSGCICKKQPLL